MAISSELLSRLESIVGSAYISTDSTILNDYGHDETEDYVFPPNVVVKPANADEISAILKIANSYKVPIDGAVKSYT